MNMVQISNKPNIHGMKNAADDAEYSSKLLAREGKLFAGLLATRFKGFAIGACIALLLIVIIPAIAKAMGL
jgi:tetrahydromethanopterin S-methyltransferase subunit F